MTSSQHKIWDVDYRRTYSQWTGGDDKPRRDELPYVVAQSPEAGQQPYVTMYQTEWCQSRCQHPWAWWFDAERSYVGFADQGEAMLFSLTFL